MSRNKWILTTTAVLMVLLLFAGYMAIAAESSSEVDPQVSASYITEVLAPETIEKVNAAIDEKTQQFQNQLNQQLAEYSEELDKIINNFEARNEDLSTNREFIKAITEQVVDKISDLQSTPSTPTEQKVSVTWKVVEVEKDRTFVFETGGMIVPRTGTSICYANSNPGLIDVTTTKELNADSPLEVNHLYIVTAAGRGFTTTGESNKFLVAGEYTIK